MSHFFDFPITVRSENEISIAKRRSKYAYTKGETGHPQLLDSFGDEKSYQMPFFITAPHLIFTKGILSGHQGRTLFMDSGLAASMPLVILDETVEFPDLKKNEIEGLLGRTQGLFTVAAPVSSTLHGF